MGQIHGIQYNGSDIDSEQSAYGSILQQYSGTCNIDCSNRISDLDITLIKSQVGTVDISQTCAVDATCTFNTTTNAVSDILFKSKNSTNANDAASGIGDISGVSINTADIQSREDITSIINQGIIQNCKMTSTNDINDVQVLSIDSNINNGIYINQNSNIAGNCVMNALMDATLKASGIMDNTASSGKDKKGSIFGTPIVEVIIIIMIVLVIIGIIGIGIYYYIQKRKK